MPSNDQSAVVLRVTMPAVGIDSSPQSHIYLLVRHHITKFPVRHPSAAGLALLGRGWQCRRLIADTCVTFAYVRHTLLSSLPPSPDRDLPSPRTQTMTAVDNLWYLADEADQRAAQTYHRLGEEYDPSLEVDRTRHVSRHRFRTVADRIRENGLPFGTHTIVYQESGELLLVYHEGVDMWVIPGGELESGETLVEGAQRELAEEAGVEADYDGLGILARVTFYSDGHDTWGVLPVFEARARAVDPVVDDPDDEISAARWFDDLPDDTRDREVLQSWRDRLSS